MLVVARVVSHDLQYRVDYVDLLFSASAAGRVELFHQHPPNFRGYSRERRRSAVFEAGNSQRVRIHLGQERASRMRFRFTGAGESLTVHRLVIRRWYGGDIVVPGEAVAGFLAPVQGGTRIAGSFSGARLTGDGGTIDVQTATRLHKDRGLATFLLPLLAGALMFVLASHFDPKTIPSLQPLFRSDDGNDRHVPELDGLRGLAALVVVADHTWGLFSGVGLVGVWIFFALSGYLLAIPFARAPGRITDPVFVRQYMLRRIARILPMYYLTIFMLYVVGGQVGSAVAHMLFLRADGHLWTIPQEMVFYLLLPLVVAALTLISRLGAVATLILLASITVLLLGYEESVPVRLAGLPDAHPLFVGWFLAGMVVSYGVHHRGTRSAVERLRGGFGVALGWISLVLLVGLILAGGSTIPAILTGDNVGAPAATHRGLFGFCAALLVFAAVVGRDSVFGAVLRFAPLRSFGIIGYSAYLLHPLLLVVVRQYGAYYAGIDPRGFTLFAATTALTWLVATVTYNLVEYPFLARRHATPVSPSLPR